MLTGLKTGELARQGGVNLQTIRFYEREGLLVQPPRTRSGYRQYSPDTVRRVRFIRRAKDLGFTLKEIGELLSLRVDTDRTCADVRAMARTKIADIESKVAELQRIGEVLNRLAQTCRGRGPTSACPILDMLEQEGTRGDR